MIADAFALSEKLGRPVLFRPTTRVCHSYASVRMLPPLPCPSVAGFSKDKGRWVIFPRISYQNHLKLVEDEREIVSEEGEGRLCPNISRKSDKAKCGIISGGVSYQYVEEALSRLDNPASVATLKINRYPVNVHDILHFVEGLEKMLVLEELDPVIERSVFEICGRHQHIITVQGKMDGTVPVAGELTPRMVQDIIEDFIAGESAGKAGDRDRAALPPPPQLPPRPPVLCQGCPHRESFAAVTAAVKAAGKEDLAVYSGDIGCYTLGNTLGATDTCLCMGAGITQAAGIHRVEPGLLNIAFIGDSTFFASGITGLANAVYNGADEIVCVLDNSTTAMTGGQPHPGMGKTLMGKDAPKLSISAIVKAMGIEDVVTVNCRNRDAALEALSDMIGKSGVRVIIFEGPCINIKPSGSRSAS
jgi:indolepyruvate ferredoxin oxidoreductase alpha subunit